MSTLYLRNVPEEVTRRLQVLADRAGLSLSALAVRELAEASRRADNATLLAGLPDLGIDPAILIADLDAGRAER